MVNYHEGDPMLPGNAELEPHEFAAFAAGDVMAVSQTGREYGTVCTDYATSQDGDAANFLVGIRALVEQSPKTLTSFRMGVPFMEGVRTGVRSRITEMIGAGRSLELAQGLAALSEFAKRPAVQAAAARQSRDAFDKLASAVHAIANPSE